MSSVLIESPSDTAAPYQWRTILRHRWPLRLMHWINLLAMLAMIGSGLQIYNAHPALYWAEASHFDTPIFSTDAMQRDNGEIHGVTQIGSMNMDTTGVLGASRNSVGALESRGFPSWATIPSWRDLATGRRWHFFFAWVWVLNGTLYIGWSLLTKHLNRDLAMKRRDWRAIPRSIGDHLKFRHPVGDAAARCNPLQKLAYLGVIFVLTPLIVLTGLSMSPQMDTVLGGWLDFVGGRQAARSIHFMMMALFVAFAVIHVLMVFYAGPINEMRSMITGRMRIRYPRGTAGQSAAASESSASSEENNHE